MQLLIDENLSPRLARWACENGYPAEAAVHVGLAGASDTSVFAQAFSRDQVVVTVNVGDFMALAAGMDVHPGVIALREAELNAQQQWRLIVLNLGSSLLEAFQRGGHLGGGVFGGGGAVGAGGSRSTGPAIRS